MRPSRGKALQVRDFLCGGGRPRSNADIYLLCCIYGWYSNPPCCSGRPTFSGVSVAPSTLACQSSSSLAPPPLAGQARVVVEHVLTRFGGGYTISCRWVRCSCSPGTPWWGCCRSLCGPVSAPLDWLWGGMGMGTVKRQPPPLLPGPASCGDVGRRRPNVRLIRSV